MTDQNQPHYVMNSLGILSKTQRLLQGRLYIFWGIRRYNRYTIQTVVTVAIIEYSMLTELVYW